MATTAQEMQKPKQPGAQRKARKAPADSLAGTVSLQEVADEMGWDLNRLVVERRRDMAWPAPQ